MTKAEDLQSDLDSPDDIDAGHETDTATAVAAQIFDSVPLKVSFAKAAFIKAQVEIEKGLDGADNFIRIDSSDRSTARSNENESDERFLDYVANVLADAERLRRREREEWERTVSSVGGVQMTGAEWREFAKRLSLDEELRDKVMESLHQRGMSEEEAKARYERITKIAEIAAIPPSQRTPEQQQIMVLAEADPTFQQDMQSAASINNNMQSMKQLIDKPTIEQQSSQPPTQQTSSSRPVAKVADMGL